MKTAMIGLLSLGLVLLLALAGTALADVDDGLTPAQSARYHALTAQFRCVVCQNRSIADSDAPLAADLRKIVARQVKAGRTNGQIKAYLVARYGDWVLYDPPFKWSTLLLWLGPFALLAFGLGLIAMLIRRRGALNEAAGGSRVDRDRLAALLADTDTAADSNDRRHDRRIRR